MKLFITKRALTTSIIVSSITYVVLSHTIDKSGKIICNGIYILSYVSGKTASIFLGDNIVTTILNNLYLINIVIEPKIKTTEVFLSAGISAGMGIATSFLVTGLELSFNFFYNKINNYIANNHLQNIKFDDDYVII